MSEPDSQDTSGLGRAFRRVWASFLEGLSLRLDLLSLELQQEKARVAFALLMILGLALVSFTAFILLNVIVVVLFWEKHGLGVLISLAAVYGIAAGVGGAWFRGWWRRQPMPLEATIEEFKKDKETWTR